MLKRLALASVALLAMAGAAAAHDISVPIDQAAPVRLMAPAEGVAIGNPSIAGVSVQNSQLLFITGRSYGTTNLVVIGANGRTLFSGRVTVTPDESGVVTVQRGMETARLTCSPVCRPRPDIGDTTTAFNAVNEQITARQGTAQAAAGNR
ncbi:MAG: pilus assembly protein N-terminal domain-containing protein [Hyphomonadaceae bacterium]